MKDDVKYNLWTEFIKKNENYYKIMMINGTNIIKI